LPVGRGNRFQGSADRRVDRICIEMRSIWRTATQPRSAGMKKHVGVLEQAGLVITEKVGRVRTCKLGLCRLEEEAAWIDRYRQLWDVRFDELDKVVDELKRKEKVDGRKKRK
jgi:DNA-binding transcriptional ArsR family regulator